MNPNDFFFGGINPNQQFQPTMPPTPMPPNMTSTGEKIKRPPNKFMVWSQAERRKICEASPEMHMAEVSKELGRRWTLMTAEERAPYAAEADRIRIQHLKDHPDYKYQPKKKPKRKEAFPDEQEEEQMPKKPKMEPMIQIQNIKIEQNWNGNGPFQMGLNGLNQGAYGNPYGGMMGYHGMAGGPSYAPLTIDQMTNHSQIPSGSSHHYHSAHPMLVAPSYSQQHLYTETDRHSLSNGSFSTTESGRSTTSPANSSGGGGGAVRDGSEEFVYQNFGGGQQQQYNWNSTL